LLFYIPQLTGTHRAKLETGWQLPRHHRVT
jgi:hypothetical protein